MCRLYLKKVTVVYRWLEYVSVLTVEDLESLEVYEVPCLT